jgi:hypothetical protein
MILEREKECEKEGQAEKESQYIHVIDELKIIR